jgi:hypothetical protein
MRKKKVYVCEGQLSLFDLDLLPIECQTPEERLESLRHRDVYRYRTKTVKAGNMLECEIFPIWNAQEAKRARKAMPSSKAQENLNHKNTKKKIMRLANVNFKDGDLWGTFGYDKNSLPDSPEAARKDIVNFMRRLKRAYKKQGLPLKYIYVTERGRDGAEESEAPRCHHHVIMSGGLDRDTIESLWKGGAYPQTRRLRVKEDCGLNGLAAYISKGGRCEKTWAHSVNLKPPIETVADKKITPRQAEKIIIDENAAPALFEKVCKGYSFRDIEIKRSEFVAGVYMYVQMYRRQ